nr:MULTISPECIES: GGDEF domain-containing protein [Myxococcaceae]
MSSGLAHYEASRDAGPPPPPTAVLTGLSFDQQRADPHAPGVQQVPKGARTVELLYSVPSYVSPTALETQVRLVGFEDAWREGEAVGRARYTALPPGDYRFEARARLGPGAWGPVASLAFHVPTPWWRHPAWLMVFGLALTGLVVLAVRWQTARLRKENERLEALVRERTRELEETTLLDPLTGAKNRRFLRLTLPEDANRVLRRWSTSDRRTRELGPPNADLLFFMVDLDYFKQVNDTYGHAMGDRVLQQASDVLRSVLRETDTLVRWGGEEFLVVAQQTDRRAAEAIALKLRDAIRHHTFDLGNGQTLRCTTSIGFAAFPFFPGAPEALPWEEVLELADRCLYAAKRSGRDGWVGLVSLVEQEGIESAPALRERVGKDLEALLDTGTVELRSSFGPERKVAFR